LVTNLPRSLDALNAWRRYHGRADLENRIRDPTAMQLNRFKPETTTPLMRRVQLNRSGYAEMNIKRIENKSLRLPTTEIH
jgi:hypothetical protein